MKNNFFGKIAIIGDGITAKLAAIMFKNLKIEPVLIANKRKNKSVSHATISISNNTANILEQNGIQVIKRLILFTRLSYTNISIVVEKMLFFIIRQKSNLYPI